ASISREAERGFASLALLFLFFMVAFCFVRCVGVLSSGINQKLRHKTRPAKISSNLIRCFVREEMIGAPNCSVFISRCETKRNKAPLDVNSRVTGQFGSGLPITRRSGPIDCTTFATIPGHLAGGSAIRMRLDETVT